MAAFGAALHWAFLLPAGYKVNAAPGVSALCGWGIDEKELPEQFLRHGPHVRDWMEAWLHQRGFRTRTHKPPFLDVWSPGATGPVVLCETSSRVEKSWPHWSELRRLLDEAGIPHIPQSLGPLGELVAQFKSARGVIAVDSGPMHLASYMGVPTTGIFVATSPEKHGPLGKRSAWLSTPSPAQVLATYQQRCNLALDELILF